MPEPRAQASFDPRSGGDACASSPAVFLDRDGTINREKTRIVDPAGMELIPGAGASIARLNRSRYRTVVVTNQAVIARGECSEATLQLVHERMEELLLAHGARVERIYYCPHFPQRGSPAGRIELQVRCECRKPQIGMLTRAARDLNLTLPGSWMVGDSTSDVEAARRAGINSIVLSSGHGGRDGKWPVQPDAQCVDLRDAVGLILDRWPAMTEALRPMVSRIARGDIVLMGGNVRCGKSQYAAALRRLLEAGGKPAAVVCLDTWLRGVDDRHGPSLLDRYDLASAVNFLRLAAAGGRFQLPSYDRPSRRSIPHGLDLRVAAGAVLIVEGVPALASPALLGMAQHRILVRRDGHPHGAGRLHEDFPLVEASLGNAEFVLYNGSDA